MKQNEKKKKKKKEKKRKKRKKRKKYPVGQDSQHYKVYIWSKLSGTLLYFKVCILYNEEFNS